MRIGYQGLITTTLTLVGLLLVVPAFAQTTVDISPSKDNSIYSESDTLSNGQGDHLLTGRNGGGDLRRALLQFDITSNVPAGSTIDSVKLVLNLSQKNTADVARTTVFNKVLADWGEGASDAIGNEGQGAKAQTGDATWTHTFSNTQSWATAGGDFVALPSVSLSVDNIAQYTFGSTAGMVADVQDWLDNPGSNFGWLIRGDESEAGTGRRFDSRSNPTPGNRPVLKVGYTVVTSAEDVPGQLPQDFALSQNYPNPFNPSTSIDYTLPVSSDVLIEVFNVLGQPITTLLQGIRPAGSYTVTWQGGDAFGNAVSSGIYFYRIAAGDYTMTRKMLLLK